MKTSKLLAVALASAALMTGCAKGDEESNLPDSGKQIHTLEATTPDDSRTTLDGVSVNWAEGDALGVVEYRDKDATDWAAWKPVTYTLTSGAGEKTAIFSAEEGITTEKLLAVFPASACRTNSYICYLNIPAKQTYVKDGIANDLLPMYAFSDDPKKLSFKYAAGVLRVPVYADVEGVKLANVTLSVEAPVYEGSSGTPTNGVFAIACDVYFSPKSWGTFYGQSHQSTGSSITYEMNGTELSADAANPTILNIVVSTHVNSNILKNLTFKFEAVDGRSFFKAKSSPLTVTTGTVVKFPALACTFKDVEDVLVKVDDAEAQPWSEYLKNPTIATSTIKVATQNDAFVTAGQLSLLKQQIEKCAAPIVLDMQDAKYETAIFPDTFKYLAKLSEIYLPKNITEIAVRAFMGCGHLTDPHLHEGLLRIRQEAFNNTPINPLYIPASVTTIDYFILRGTGSTYAGNKAYEVDADNQNYKSVDGVLYSKDGTTLVEYPENNGYVEFRIPDGVETLAQYSMMESVSLKTVILPASLKTIRASVFQSCGYLEIINCKALTGEIPTLDGLTYAAAGSDSAKGMYPGSKTANKKVVYVPEGRADEFKAAWPELVTAGWTFSDDGIPGEVSGALSDLDNSTYDDASFWK